MRKNTSTACLAAIKPILDSIDASLSAEYRLYGQHRCDSKEIHRQRVPLRVDQRLRRSKKLNARSGAKGEWYMFLDADEIFKSCNDIIHFFKSGEYKKYRSARYTDKEL